MNLVSIVNQDSVGTKASEVVHKLVTLSKKEDFDDEKFDYGGNSASLSKVGMET